MPPAVTHKKRLAMEPISYDELMTNAGMSGFVSFLEHASVALAGETACSTKAAADMVGGLACAAAAMPQPVPGHRGRIRKAVMVEDGHSLAEQAVYGALWEAGSPVGDGEEADRTVRIGYQRLAQRTRLSWVSVKANLRTLERKLAIEVTGCENSATREGKCYLVYSPAAILERRRQAGLEWVRRTRGVELLTGPKPID